MLEGYVLSRRSFLASAAGAVLGVGACGIGARGGSGRDGSGLEPYIRRKMETDHRG